MRQQNLINDPSALIGLAIAIFLGVVIVRKGTQYLSEHSI